QLYTGPLHPYSVALLSAVPIPDPVIESRRRRIILTGDVPSSVNPPKGCRFHTRCWLRERLGNPDRCVSDDPQLRPLSTGHEVACHFAEHVDGAAEQRQVLGLPVVMPAGGLAPTPVPAAPAPPEAPEAGGPFIPPVA
ncbi:MAG TPA: oligopeptide/dipeptide ABC transporter ATP-binding protein, partial [Candidatus Limnocylindrales bacterium]